MPSITVLSWGPLVMFGAMPARQTDTQPPLKPLLVPSLELKCSWGMEGVSHPHRRTFWGLQAPCGAQLGGPRRIPPAAWAPGKGRGLAPTGHGQVRGGLHLAGRVAGEALEHAGVIGEQPADLQAAICQELEAGQLLQADEGSVLVPGHVGGRHACKEPGPRQERGCGGTGRVAGEWLTFGLAGDGHHLLHLGRDVPLRLLDELWRLCKGKPGDGQGVALELESSGPTAKPPPVTPASRFPSQPRGRDCPNSLHVWSRLPAAKVSPRTER